jgi:hypothetical protein
VSQGAVRDDELIRWQVNRTWAAPESHAISILAFQSLLRISMRIKGQKASPTEMCELAAVLACRRQCGGVTASVQLEAE